ncbi:MAG: hypothetical protein ACOY32_03875 [Thermodesulfobacteriota bacterium]
MRLFAAFTSRRKRDKVFLPNIYKKYIAATEMNGESFMSAPASVAARQIKDSRPIWPAGFSPFMNRLRLLILFALSAARRPPSTKGG